MITTILILAVVALVTGWLILYIVRRIQSSKMRQKIASEGFETAMDVLYPHKRRKLSKYRMGPVVSE
jgi:NADH:ubiquinone oxidoreductase subunit 3 (subunit A)